MPRARRRPANLPASSESPFFCPDGSPSSDRLCSSLLSSINHIGSPMHIKAAVLAAAQRVKTCTRVTEAEASLLEGIFGRRNVPRNALLLTKDAHLRPAQLVFFQHVGLVHALLSCRLLASLDDDAAEEEGEGRVAASFPQILSRFGEAVEDETGYVTFFVGREEGGEASDAPDKERIVCIVEEELARFNVAMYAERRRALAVTRRWERIGAAGESDWQSAQGRATALLIVCAGMPVAEITPATLQRLCRGVVPFQTCLLLAVLLRNAVSLAGRPVLDKSVAYTTLTAASVMGDHALAHSSSTSSLLSGGAGEGPCRSCLRLGWWVGDGGVVGPTYDLFVEAAMIHSMHLVVGGGDGEEGGTEGDGGGKRDDLLLPHLGSVIESVLAKQLSACRPVPHVGPSSPVDRAHRLCVHGGSRSDHTSSVGVLVNLCAFAIDLCKHEAGGGTSSSSSFVWSRCRIVRPGMLGDDEGTMTMRQTKRRVAAVVSSALLYSHLHCSPSVPGRGEEGDDGADDDEDATTTSTVLDVDSWDLLSFTLLPTGRAPSPPPTPLPPPPAAADAPFSFAPFLSLMEACQIGDMATSTRMYFAIRRVDRFGRPSHGGSSSSPPPPYLPVPSSSSLRLSPLVGAILFQSLVTLPPPRPDVQTELLSMASQLVPDDPGVVGWRLVCCLRILFHALSFSRSNASSLIPSAESTCVFCRTAALLVRATTERLMPRYGRLCAVHSLHRVGTALLCIVLPRVLRAAKTFETVEDECDACEASIERDIRGVEQRLLLFWEADDGGTASPPPSVPPRRRSRRRRKKGGGATGREEDSPAREGQVGTERGGSVEDKGGEEDEGDEARPLVPLVPVEEEGVEDLLCPITFRPLLCAVVLGDGSLVDEDGWDAYLKYCSSTSTQPRSPTTGLPMEGESGRGVVSLPVRRMVERLMGGEGE